MAKIDTLLRRVADSQLRADLSAAIAEIQRSKDFGLVFESHLPETVRLHRHPLRRGLKVARRDANNNAVWLVERVKSETATLIPLRDSEGTTILGADAKSIEATVEDLVVVADYGDTIYPGLRQVGSVDRGGEKPAHIVINSENLHALETLRFTHAAKIDCIYIDPPYNTGAKDWKYNNDYVDTNDRFRHSKWLSFIQRRLNLARALLSDNGTLVITIDEHEVNNLGVLLHQTYPEARIQLVSIVMNPSGSTAPGQFSRAEEYAFFCRFGSAAPVPMPTDLLSGSNKSPNIWDSFHRSRGINDRPSKRPNLVYPIAIDPDTLRVVEIGPTLKEKVDTGEMGGDLDQWMPDSDERIGGNPVVWPVLDSGEMSVWQTVPDTLRSLLCDGFFRVRRPQKKGPRPFTLAYVKSGNRQKTLDGVFRTIGSEPCGARKIEVSPQNRTAKTVWKVPEHDARQYGTSMLRSLVGRTDFSYPKSPYAVADTLKTIVGDNKTATILDFFAGTGTTLQSAAMLNAEDNGQRQVILVTNNEVGAETEKGLAGLIRPGDQEYEAQGIFNAVTVPRIQAAIEGTFQGRPVVGKYEGQYAGGRFLSEGFEENVKFFELTYLDAAQVELDMAFNAIAPLLWIRAGSKGRIIAESLDPLGQRKPYAWTDLYAVLFNTDHWQPFVAKLPLTVRTAFVVTDSPTTFSIITSELPGHVQDTVRLYERYLTTFAVNQENP